MTEYRIISYDGKRIVETIDVMELIKKLIIHIIDKQFKMIRYYAIYAQNTKERLRLIKMVNDKVKEFMDFLKYQVYHRLRRRRQKDKATLAKFRKILNYNSIAEPRDTSHCGSE